MHRLIYKSRSSSKIDKATIRDIMYSSLEYNRDNGLTGLLVASRSHFLQVLEGSRQELNKLFFRIARDPRHDQMELISFGPAAKRLFGRWAMKGFGLFEVNKDIEPRLIAKYGAERGGVRLPEEEWECLSFMHDIEFINQKSG